MPNDQIQPPDEAVSTLDPTQGISNPSLTWGKILSSRHGILQQWLGQKLLGRGEEQAAKERVPQFEQLLGLEGSPLNPDQQKIIQGLPPLLALQYLSQREQALAKRKELDPESKPLVDPTRSTPDKPYDVFVNARDPQAMADAQQKGYITPAQWAQMQHRKDLEQWRNQVGGQHLTDRQEWMKEHPGASIDDYYKFKQGLELGTAGAKLRQRADAMENLMPAAMVSKSVTWVDPTTLASGDGLTMTTPVSGMSKRGLVPLPLKTGNDLQMVTKGKALLDQLDQTITALPKGKGLETATGLQWAWNNRYPTNKWVDMQAQLNAASETVSRALIGGTSRSTQMWQRTHDTLISPHMDVNQAHSAILQYKKALEADARALVRQEAPAGKAAMSQDMAPDFFKDLDSPNEGSAGASEGFVPEPTDEGSGENLNAW